MASVAQMAWDAGTTFDLSGIGYGQIHWGNMQDVVTKPYQYYFFLAGMVRVTGARKVVEIGTHQGGSALAMAKGFADPDSSRLVTFDITEFGANMFRGHSHIRGYQLDANSEAAYDSCREVFGSDTIDFIYIDTTHLFWPTFLSMQIYVEGFSPQFAVLDDITLNPEMERLWQLVRRRYGAENTIDVTDVIPQVRPPSRGFVPGFGLVRIRPRRTDIVLG